MESESSSDDDYESHLYSLLHYCGENLEERNLVPGTPLSETVLVGHSGSSGVTAPLYQNKRSKVFRWNMVKHLTGASDVPPCANPQNGITGTLSSDIKNTQTLKPGQQQEIQNNYISLLHAYEEARSNCVQVTLAKELNCRKTNSEYRYKRRFQKEETLSSSLTTKGKKCVNTSIPINRELPVLGRKVTVSNSSHQDSVVSCAAENYHAFVHRSTYPYVTSSSANSDHSSFTCTENKCSKSQNYNHEKLLSDGVGADRNKKKNDDVRYEKRGGGNRQEDLEGEFSLSKYNLCLNKNKQNSKTESVIVLDSSDSDSESVVEVEPPVHEPPPVVSLSSDEEILENTSDERMKSMPDEDDIVVLYTGGNSTVNKVLATVTHGNIHNESAESVGSCDTVVLNGKSTMRGESLKKRGKKKKHKERAKKGRNMEKSLNPVFQSSHSTSSFISPKSWTEDMSHFYNDSWGGETFSIHQLQKSMSDDPANWHVLYSDIVSPPRRIGPDQRKKCNNCSIWGHLAHSCPDPPKPIVCPFCGKTGHSRYKCPTPICLCCGKSALVYRYGCPKCLSTNKSYKPCSVCNNVSHLPSECPETWRRYHATTTSKDLSAVSSEILYKPQEEQFCCNCARRGHQFHECRLSAEHSHTSVHNLLKRRSHKEYNRKPVKRRKPNSTNMSSFDLFFRQF